MAKILATSNPGNLDLEDRDDDIYDQSVFCLIKQYDN